MTLLVTGASGRLGRYLLREARKRKLEIAAWSGRQTGEIFGYPLTPVRLEEEEEVRSRFHAPASASLHIAAMANVSECVRNSGLAEQINHRATCLLADLAAGSCRFVYVSTDMVFGGEKRRIGKWTRLAAIGLWQNQDKGRTGSSPTGEDMHRAAEPALRA